MLVFFSSGESAWLTFRQLQARSQFTQDVVSNLNDQNPHFNYIICHVDHDKFFDGNQYEDWGHRHEELDGFFGTSTGWSNTFNFKLSRIIFIFMNFIGSKFIGSGLAASTGKVTEDT